MVAALMATARPGTWHGGFPIAPLLGTADDKTLL